MAKDNGKCGNCDCAAGTCAKENGGKCGNCDCAAGRPLACKFVPTASCSCNCKYCTGADDVADEIPIDFCDKTNLTCNERLTLGTCAKETGGKCGNCDCAAGTCSKE